ncbi:unnamed protein product [Caenorhabditis angaria]|uniref:Uncharacterized protein n=1 Tax=Caenorhabditis angaria TaxID=860376 RepID=A0A9P1N3U5_9PELO|nr:unnamed protein product [Caenorhabditis angaria]
MNNFFDKKMVAKSTLIILISLIVIAYGWIGKNEVYKHLYTRPYIVPSGERAFHSIYTHVGRSAGQNLYGPIYVAMINGEFYFGGHTENDNINLGQAVIVTNYLETITDDRFFYLHNDMIELKKTELSKDDKKGDMKEACEKAVYAVIPKAELNYSPEDFIVKFGNRMPMIYNGNQKKCIGTYDIMTDIFTCAYVDTKKVLKEHNFMWDPETGEYRQSNLIEILCRVPFPDKEYEQ